MNYQWIIGGIIVGVLLIMLWQLSRTKKIPAQIVTKFSAKIKETAALDPDHALLETHKIFVSALSTLFKDKKLTAAQKIAKVQKNLPNKQKIWHHHRLRNKIAHETDFHISSTQAEKARQDFVRALKSLEK